MIKIGLTGWGDHPSKYIVKTPQKEVGFLITAVISQ